MNDFIGNMTLPHTKSNPLLDQAMLFVSSKCIAIKYSNVLATFDTA